MKADNVEQDQCGVKPFFRKNLCVYMELFCLLSVCFAYRICGLWPIREYRTAEFGVTTCLFWLWRVAFCRPPAAASEAEWDSEWAISGRIGCPLADLPHRQT